MTLYVRATPVVPGEKELYGPYTEDKIMNVVNFARISSSRSKKRHVREVIWVCGKGSPIIIRVYSEGKRIFPKGKKGDRDGENFASLKSCMSTATGRCAVPEGSDPSVLVRGRKRVVSPACPVAAPNKKTETKIKKKKSVQDSE